MFHLTDKCLLKDLPPDHLKDVQSLLKKLGFYSGAVDGLYGPKTQTGWDSWKVRTDLGAPDYLPYIGQSSWELLQKEAGAVAGKQHDFSTKAGVIQAIIYECKAQGLQLKTQWAYVVATTHHETKDSFKPVKEGYYLKNPQAHQRSLRYFPYYGRGFVQLTWKYNYATYGKLLGADLVGKPDLACDPNVALFVLCHGFKHGAFTGRKLEDYVNSSKTDFLGARRCINGTDKKALIADLATKYLKSI